MSIPQPLLLESRSALNTSSYRQIAGGKHFLGLYKSGPGWQFKAMHNNYHNSKPFTGISTSFLLKAGLVEGSLYLASSQSDPSASIPLSCITCLSLDSCSAAAFGSAIPEKLATAYNPSPLTFTPTLSVCGAGTLDTSCTHRTAPFSQHITLALWILYQASARHCAQAFQFPQTTPLCFYSNQTWQEQVHQISAMQDS